MDTFVLTLDMIDRWVQEELDFGCKRIIAVRFESSVKALYNWLPEDKVVTKKRLESFQQHLCDSGYSKNYIRGYYRQFINRFLKKTGHEELCYGKNSHELIGKVFGAWEVLEKSESPKEETVYLCRCLNCGTVRQVDREVLVQGRSRSCGCISSENSRFARKLVANTSLAWLDNDNIVSKNSKSGYLGIVPRDGKWRAAIYFQHKRYNLGTYDTLEEAIKARQRAKEEIRQNCYDELEQQFEEKYRNETNISTREESVAIAAALTPTRIPASSEKNYIRRRGTNNLSGCSGVSRTKSGSWTAKITIDNIRYHLGTFRDYDEAVAARKKAEQDYLAAPAAFAEIYKSKISMIWPKADDGNKQGKSQGNR